MPNVKAVTVYLPANVMRKLASLAKKLDEPKVQLASRLLEQSIKDSEKPVGLTGTENSGVARAAKDATALLARINARIARLNLPELTDEQLDAFKQDGRP